MSLDPAIHPINRLARFEMTFARLHELTQLSNATRFREYGSTRAKETVPVTLTAQDTRALEGHVAALHEIAQV